MTAVAGLDHITIVPVRVSVKTTWCFVRLEGRDGIIGLGEATAFGEEGTVQRQIGALAGPLAAMTAPKARARVFEAMAQATCDGERAALSALDQALLDMNARRQGRSVAALLGACGKAPVRVYANINRGTSDRSPEGHATRAQAAVAAGYDAIKLAPFDGVRDGEPLDAVQTGIDRVLAVRERVGPNVAIAVDCHARFQEEAAKAVITSLAPAHPIWIEEPLPETADNAPALKRLRHHANNRGIMTAGAETVTGLAEVEARIAAGGMDVLLPDIRFCGGVESALAIAERVDAAGLHFSLHNPVGPVLDAVSLGVASIAPAMIMVERTFREAPLQSRLTAPAMADPDAPGFGAHTAPGWGLDLSPDAMDRVGLLALSAEGMGV